MDANKNRDLEKVFILAINTYQKKKCFTIYKNNNLGFDNPDIELFGRLFFVLIGAHDIFVGCHYELA